jgi:hypothetical protein
MLPSLSASFNRWLDRHYFKTCDLQRINLSHQHLNLYRYRHDKQTGWARLNHHCFSIADYTTDHLTDVERLNQAIFAQKLFDPNNVVFVEVPNTYVKVALIKQEKSSVLSRSDKRYLFWLCEKTLHLSESDYQIQSNKKSRHSLETVITAYDRQKLSSVKRMLNGFHLERILPSFSVCQDLTFYKNKAVLYISAQEWCVTVFNDNAQAIYVRSHALTATDAANIDVALQALILAVEGFKPREGVLSAEIISHLPEPLNHNILVPEGITLHEWPYDTQSNKDMSTLDQVFIHGAMGDKECHYGD